ncbi:monosaccharide ABC transporter ATP-binding protein, CUT2 family [Rubellimicrobium thermophilum DSM 16684]|uniref:Monosaccharide ABC transporter ATP-binding protein, CUT2 family n=1 Tax=Rubellimicrobium thermophilum DSM 16684 TaxID=1123069 RepID=S9R6A1_9RHOB|nr:ATP-binding cassette domain-containing protein [Rubellimicrobium thermophilum]EPX87437.1 monosaccharide ABC transporter ATP-binding protein, CUT2 family [Rubellimicrobium thermophilum DSM 16684]
MTTRTRGVASQDPPLAIGAEHVAKSFGHVTALRDASIAVRPGEIVALCGDNGAGKSTFLRVLQGIYRPDAGRVIIGGQEVDLTSVRDAQALGVDTVHQDLALAPDLSTVDNIFLGHEIRRRGVLGGFGILDRAEMAERADAALKELSIALPSLTVPVRELSGGQRQAVAIARAVMWSSKAVLMDEPTAALAARQSRIVCDLMRSVADRGLGVLVVSHDLPAVLEVAHRVVVLWRGKTVLDAPAADLTVPDLVATMVGHVKEAA